MSRETYMMESLTREMIMRRMDEKRISMREAMDEVYNSKTYKALNRMETGLYFQSVAYVYDMMEEEFNGKQHGNL